MIKRTRKECAACGKHKLMLPDQIYCGLKCWDNSLRCVHCNKQLQGSQEKFCSIRCASAYRRPYWKKWIEANRESVKRKAAIRAKIAYSKLTESDRLRYNAYQRERRRKNNYNAKQRAYRAKNKEAFLERDRAYRARNEDKCKLYKENRKLRLLSDHQARERAHEKSKRARQTWNFRNLDKVVLYEMRRKAPDKMEATRIKNRERYKNRTPEQIERAREINRKANAKRILLHPEEVRLRAREWARKQRTPEYQIQAILRRAAQIETELKESGLGETL